jgi:hypothetical protein
VPDLPDPPAVSVSDPSRHEEWQAAGRLAADALGGAVDVVADTHRAVARRVQRFLPPSAAPVAAMQQGIIGAVYTGLAAGGQLLPAALARTAARSGEPDAPPLSHSPVGRWIVPVVNGMWGDRVAAHHPPLAVPMAVRVNGRDLSLTAPAVAEAFPSASARLVVFVHGLVESEQSWWVTSERSGNRSYGDRFHADHDLTPVYLRYNSGLRISDNGQRLARLLDELIAAWPRPVEQVSLVGHSMGGLIGRSACHYGEQRGAAWVPAIRHVVTLGTPHTGAPLERVAHAAAWMMSRLPETEPVSRVLAARSAGIQDLRFGNLVEEDWDGHDPDEFLRDRCTDVPFLPHTTYYWVAASITRDTRHPLGQLLGDGLVRYPSATGVGRSRRIPFELHEGAHLGGVHHVSLLNHPDVYARLEEWLTVG